MHYYIPAGQERSFGGSVMLVRASNDVHSIVPDVRRILLQLDPAITYVRMESLQERIDPQMRPWKIGASVFALSGVLALIVAAIGIYSVMSYLIADRRHEIGVRLALGALASDITRLVMRGSFAIAVIGIVIGQLLALSLGKLVEPLLFDTSSRDPLVFAGVGAILMLVALSATLVPALRARKVNPMEALRTE
jgi:ABC-type antimicrobial peptide transport system permease subunit